MIYAEADKKSKDGKLRVLYECFPMAFLVEKDSGAIVKPHFHQADQYQVVVQGGGKSAATLAQPVVLAAGDRLRVRGNPKGDGLLQPVAALQAQLPAEKQHLLLLLLYRWLYHLFLLPYLHA